MTASTTSTDYFIEMADRYGAHNYKPLPVVIAKADGVWVEDVDGKKYMDMLAAYSAVNQGHRHPRLVKAMTGAGRTLHADLARVPQRPAARVPEESLRS